MRRRCWPTSTCAEVNPCSRRERYVEVLQLTLLPASHHGLVGVDRDGRPQIEHRAHTCRGAGGHGARRATGAWASHPAAERAAGERYSRHRDRCRGRCAAGCRRRIIEPSAAPKPPALTVPYPPPEKSTETVPGLPPRGSTGTDATASCGAAKRERPGQRETVSAGRAPGKSPWSADALARLRGRPGLRTDHLDRGQASD